MSFINIFKSISNFQFPYTLDDKTVYETSLWQVFNGTRKSDSFPVSVFKANRSQQNEKLIANAIHKSKVLKLPGLCNVLETFDSDPQSTFIITERVKPFPWENVGELQKNIEGIELGISQILTTLKFLNAFVLGTISRESIYIGSKGQWLLFGLELCQKKDEIDQRMFAYDIQLYNRLLGLQTATEDFQKVDALRLGSLITELMGGSTRIPKDWQPLVQQLSRARVNIDAFITKMESTSTWLSNPLIMVYQQLKEIHIKEPQDKLAIMSQIQTIFFESGNLFHNLSPGLIEGMLLPELSNIIQWLITSHNGSASSIARLIPFLAIFLELTIDRDYFPETSKNLLYECFALPDRQVRFLLLIYLPKISKNLTSSEISGKIFPRFSQGLADSDSTLRLQTLKNIHLVVPHITERQLNNELLRHLAKTQVDQDVDIRTWTVIIITRIATLLSTSSGNRASILATAFTKSLKDPVIKPRLAALYGLDKTIDLFDVTTIANKILTVIAPGLLDKDPLVRSKAKNLFQNYLNKLESEAQSLQNDSQNGERSKDVNFDEYGKNEEFSDAELVKQFMSTVMISSVPDQVLSPSENPIGKARGTLDTFEDKGNNEVSENSSDSINKPSTKGIAIAVEKSWNNFDDDDSIDDGWADSDIWEKEVIPQSFKEQSSNPSKKVSILNGTRTKKASILSPRPKTTQATGPSRTSTRSLQTSRTTKTAVVLDNSEDDAWDTAW